MDKRVLTLEETKKIAAAAEAEANKNNWPVVIAIVDDGGHLLYLQRGHETQFGSIEVAIVKAKAAVAFKRPTKVWEDRVTAEGRLGYLGLPGLVFLEGGIPIFAEGMVIGGIGVSGVASNQDAQIAKAGADALPQEG